MNAVEFFRSIGLLGVKSFLRNGNIRSLEMALELQRLVESWELVQKDFESIEMAEYEYMISGCYSEPYWVRVKQAIRDVESVGGGV